jgi:hypothetical protein
MNDELYQMLTLDRIRGFANKEELNFNAEDHDTIIVWLYDLSKELFKLREHLRRRQLGWKNQPNK